MKSNKQATASANGDGKTETRKAPFRAARKAASRTARSSETTSKRRMPSTPGNSHYGEFAARFLGRAKSAIGDAYGWAGDATSALPNTMRAMSLPSQRTMRNLIEEKPLVLGALGLGIGVALGAMLPSVGELGPRFSRDNGKKRRTTVSSRK